MLGAAGALVVVLAMDDDDKDEPTGDPVTLESVTSPGANPFVTGSAVAQLSLSTAAVDAAEAISGDLEVDDATGGRIATGTEPGLYGGTMDEQACDPFALADFLETEPEKAAAWAEVLGIAAADIRPYIENLTPVLLTADTWVTNHGFENGAATGFQSVLQAGSAVLIDEHGVPRVRCFCGNPLTQPETDDYTLHATEGEKWDDYEPESVRQVRGSDETLETVTLIDAETGAKFDRGLGPGQTGQVQATLRWTGTADMDLHVIDANGEEIYFGASASSSGGELDLDKIPGCDTHRHRTAHREHLLGDRRATGRVHGVGHTTTRRATSRPTTACRWWSVAAPWSPRRARSRRAPPRAPATCSRSIRTGRACLPVGLAGRLVAEGDDVAHHADADPSPAAGHRGRRRARLQLLAGVEAHPDRGVVPVEADVDHLGRRAVGRVPAVRADLDLLCSYGEPHRSGLARGPERDDAERAPGLGAALDGAVDQRRVPEERRHPRARPG